MENILRPHSDLLFNTIPQMQTDPEFEPYIKRYEALKAQYTGIHTSISTKVFLSASPLPVKDYESSLKKSAFCVLPLDIIIVDRDTWEHYQDEVRQFILFHELGHCDLDQGHNSNHIMDTYKSNLDKPAVIRETIDWDPLYEEFFSMKDTNASTIIICHEGNFEMFDAYSLAEIKRRVSTDDQLQRCESKEDFLNKYNQLPIVLRHFLIE